MVAEGTARFLNDETTLFWPSPAEVWPPQEFIKSSPSKEVRFMRAKTLNCLLLQK